MLVVGLVGKPRAGKGELSRLIREKIPEWIDEKCFGKKISIATPRFSDYPREELAKRGIPISRDSMQKFVQEMDKEALTRGEEAGALSREVKKRIELLRDANLVIVDGVRWLFDEAMIRSFPHNLMVYVVASAEDRYERMIESGENAGDALKTFEEFLVEDNAVNEQFIEEIGERADFTIQNDEGLPRFKEKAGYFIFSEIVIARLLQKKCC